MVNHEHHHYQGEITNLLNQYLANTAVLIMNLYNYHWNIVGPNFISMHEKLEEYYKTGTDMFDEIAERIKQLNGFPLTSLSQYEQVAQIKNIPSQDYHSQDIIKALIKDFNFMNNIGLQISNLATTNNDEVTNAILTEHSIFFEKELWMLQAHLK